MTTRSQHPYPFWAFVHIALFAIGFSSAMGSMARAYDITHVLNALHHAGHSYNTMMIADWEQELQRATTECFWFALLTFATIILWQDAFFVVILTWVTHTPADTSHFK